MGPLGNQDPLCSTRAVSLDLEQPIRARSATLEPLPPHQLWLVCVCYKGGPWVRVSDAHGVRAAPPHLGAEGRRRPAPSAASYFFSQLRSSILSAETHSYNTYSPFTQASTRRSSPHSIALASPSFATKYPYLADPPPYYRTHHARSQGYDVGEYGGVIRICRYFSCRLTFSQTVLLTGYPASINSLLSNRSSTTAEGLWRNASMCCGNRFLEAWPLSVSDRRTRSPFLPVPSTKRFTLTPLPPLLAFDAPGDEIVVVIKKARPIPIGTTASGPKIRKGDVCRAVVVRTKKELRRPDGRVVRFDDNACVLLNNKKDPMGTRVNGTVAAELRGRGWSKILSLAGKVV